MNKRAIVWTGVLVALLGTSGAWYLTQRYDEKKGEATAVTSPAANSADQLKQQQEKQQASASFAIRGVIEGGTYGASWTHEQRLSMFEFMSSNRYNTYVYAPANDPFQRVDWALPYPEEQASKLKELIQKAKESGLRFVYSISPGLSLSSQSSSNSAEMKSKAINYSSEEDQQKLFAKTEQLRKLGVDTILLSFDQAQGGLSDKDRGTYGTNYAQAHVTLANSLLEEVRKKDSNFQLWFMPTQYYGVKENSYWVTLREQLEGSIEVIWTGPEILSKKIEAADADKAAQLLGRKPLVWDHYPINDYTYEVEQAPKLFFGPLEHRSNDLQTHVTGLLANTMVQLESSKPALYSIGQYLDHPASYDPQKAYVESLSSLSGIERTELFNKFTDYSRRSIIADDKWNPKFKALVDAGDKERLRKEFEELRDLRKNLSKAITNRQLVTEIDPWLMKLSREGELGLLALQMLAKEQGSAERAELIEKTRVELEQLKLEPYKIGEEILAYVEQLLWKE
ncbi:beta-N-acetylglucosaminidase domain-containing protein [Tumebacillus lipolyticus]|uniref:Beta-N-acetylglucosaminidase domain-containing protein n=1 Tax=Tumebacillus lipolyticus TaxID=1280370 RepID=A0ABW4ZT48_9BACL